MSDPVTLTIDGQSVTVEAGTTIHKAAQSMGIEIPTICYHEHCTSNGLCRMCVVEVEGRDRLVTACSQPVEEWMKIRTHSPRVITARKTIVELLQQGAEQVASARDVIAFAQLVCHARQPVDRDGDRNLVSGTYEIF